MNRFTSFAFLVIGLLLLYFGFNASDSVASEVSQAVQGAPTDKSIWLIATGILGSVIGAAGLLFGRRST